MYTYAMAFRAEPNLAGDAFIQSTLAKAGCTINRAEYPYYEVTHSRNPSGFQPFIDGAFQGTGGLGPTRLYPGDLATLYKVLEAEAADPRLNARRLALQLINQSRVEPIPDVSKATPTELTFALLQAAEQVYRTELVPARSVIAGQLAHIQAQQGGLIERWANLEREELRLGKLLHPGNEGYYDNPRYQGTKGLLNLCVQRLCWEFIETYSPTDDNGEVMGDGDVPTHDLAWTLMNFLDGEYNHAPALADSILEANLQEVHEARSTIGGVAEDLRITLFESMEAELVDATATILADWRTLLHLPAAD